MKNSIYFTGIPYRSSCFFNCVYFLHGNSILFDILSIFELCPSCCALQGIIIYYFKIIFFIPMVFDIYVFMLCFLECVFISFKKYRHLNIFVFSDTGGTRQVVVVPPSLLLLPSE